MTTYSDNFGMNGKMNQNGLKPSQPLTGYPNVEQYKVPQSTSQDTPTAQPQTREAPSMVTSAPQSNFPKNMWRYGTKYEVKDDETFAFYEGYVVDYNASDKKVHVVYEDDWKAPVWVDITYIRPCQEFDRATWHPNDGDHIECMAKAEEYEPSGWWGCQLVCEQHDHYLIAFDGWDETHNEILEKDMLRPYGGDPPFDIDTPFITTVFQMDKPSNTRERDEFEQKMRGLRMHEDDLNDRIFQWAAKMPPQFDYIRRESNLLHLGYFPQRRNCLVMIGVTAAIQTATLALKYLLILQKRWILNDESQREKHQKTQEDIDKYEKAKKLEVEFPAFLTNYLIGRKGENISSIREDIDGLLELKVIDEGKCLIVAATAEAAERAREKVDMVVEYVPVPKSTVREIIGPRGASIRELEEQSGVTFIQTEDRFLNWYGDDNVPQLPPKGDHEVIMVIAGTRGDVETCSHLLRMKADHALRMEAARGRKQAAMQEWENLNGDKPRYMGAYPDDDDDDYPEPGDARYGGGKRPGSARERRRGNRRYQRASTSAGGDGADGGDGSGVDPVDDVGGMDADMGQMENDIPYDLDDDGDEEDDGGFSYQQQREPRYKYVVKGSSESKGQSEEVANEQ